jgi:hypothetical protein
MAVERVTSRERLGELRVSWHVDRDTGEVLSDALDPRARAVQVSETLDRDHAALVFSDPATGWRHLDKLDEWIARLRSETGPLVVKARGLQSPAGTLITHGCHRTCALYSLDAEHWMLELSLNDVDRAPGVG